jgi:ATP-dependent helicase/DNAse subunit B
MSTVKTFHFKDNFIKELTGFLKEGLIKKRDLSRTAVVFGGKRPALFLKKELYLSVNAAFIPPDFFSIDEFVTHIAIQNCNFFCLSGLDACYSIFKLIQSQKPDILKNRKSFADFLPWAKEFVSFMDQIDLENIADERLRNIENNADIGYEVPESLNNFLGEIVDIRRLYHNWMRKTRRYSRGFLYLSAAGAVDKIHLDEYEDIIFCNFFKLHSTEKIILKSLFKKRKASLFFQKDENDWEEFKQLENELQIKITVPQVKKYQNSIKIYAGFDIHSQIGIVKEIIKELSADNRLKDTVIVLPKSDALIPLLSEISCFSDDYNVSMGYPVSCSSLCDVLNLIIRAQKNKHNGKYYSKDFLALLMHPLIKNIEAEDARLTRIIVHKIEEILVGEIKTDFSGSIFVDFSLFERSEILFDNVLDECRHIMPSLGKEDIRQTLNFIDEQVFKAWDKITGTASFIRQMTGFINMLIEKSMLKSFSLNLKVAEKVLDILSQFRITDNEDLIIDKIECFKIFEDMLRQEKIAFSGAPLKGLQILGLFETRALTFENVIIIDVNESVLPKLSVNEPLVPRGILASLGLDRLETEERIQRYQFMRLISSAQNVHLVYNDSPSEQRSRFIEEIIWEQEKNEKKIKANIVPRAFFDCDVQNKKGYVAKNEKMLKLLKNLTFSATSLNVYIKCPMQFYFKYVLGLSEKNNLLEDIESREIGTFIHKLLEDEFSRLLNKEYLIDDSFKKRFFNKFENYFTSEFSHRMQSDGFMIKQILQYRLERFLAQEQKRNVKKIIALEIGLKNQIRLKSHTIDFKCRIDRIDQIEKKKLLVIDYKTGSTDALPAGLLTLQKNLEDLQRKNIKSALRSVQLPLYLFCAKQEYRDYDISSALYNLRNLKIDEFPKPKENQHQEEIMECVFIMLDKLINDLFDIDQPFEADGSDENCRYCPFINICC